MNQDENIQLRYSDEDLMEFEQIISHKLSEARKELSYLKTGLTKQDDSGIDGTISNAKTLDDGADTAEKENMNQLAARLQKFVSQLEAALVRIKNKTYGICVDTGRLIPKDRLRAVPHTQHSIEAKLAKNK